MVPHFRWRPKLYARTKMAQSFPRILSVESIFFLNWAIQTKITPRTQIFPLNFQSFSNRTISLLKRGGKKGTNALQLMFPACRWRPNPYATTRIKQSLLSYDDPDFFIISCDPGSPKHLRKLYFIWCSKRKKQVTCYGDPV